MNLRIAIVGAGRLGSLLARALRESGHDVSGPHGRGFDGADHDVVLLCVPDGAIAQAAIAVAEGPIIGHCSGATALAALGERECLALHPLMTVTGEGASLAGAGCAIAGSTPRALALAGALARDLGMQPFELLDEDRAAYHAAASIASNFLVTLEAAAARLAATAGLPPEAFVPLARASLENWAQLGASRALTGPIARGDEATVARQRDAVGERAPELLALFDALADATRDLARGDAPSRQPVSEAIA